MQAILSEALPLTATPKGVIQKRATKLTLIHMKAPRLKNGVIAYLIPANPEWTTPVRIVNKIHKNP